MTTIGWLWMAVVVLFAPGAAWAGQVVPDQDVPAFEEVLAPPSHLAASFGAVERPASVAGHPVRFEGSAPRLADRLAPRFTMDDDALGAFAAVGIYAAVRWIPGAVYESNRQAQDLTVSDLSAWLQLGLACFGDLALFAALYVTSTQGPAYTVASILILTGAVFFHTWIDLAAMTENEFVDENYVGRAAVSYAFMGVLFGCWLIDALVDGALSSGGGLELPRLATKGPRITPWVAPRTAVSADVTGLAVSTRF